MCQLTQQPSFFSPFCGGTRQWAALSWPCLQPGSWKVYWTSTEHWSSFPFSEPGAFFLLGLPRNVAKLMPWSVRACGKQKEVLPTLIKCLCFPKTCVEPQSQCDGRDRGGLWGKTPSLMTQCPSPEALFPSLVEQEGSYLVGCCFDLELSSLKPRWRNEKRLCLSLSGLFKGFFSFLPH